MTLELDRITLPQASPDGLSPPDVSPAGRDALARLMLDAYRGTPDDAGETLDDAKAEIDRLFAGNYGTFDVAASNVRPADDRIVAATLLTRDKLGPRGGTPTNDPFLAFSMTAADHKRQGLARQGLCVALHSLRARGEQRVHLVVSQNNPAAINLYASLGFTVRG